MVCQGSLFDFLKLIAYPGYNEDEMRVLLQKVSQASVTVDDSTIGAIEEGYLLFLGVMKGDTKSHADQLAEKISKLRLFEGKDGKINDLSILDVQGAALVVSQFTLAGRTEKGNRPDYTHAAPPEDAEELYEYFVDSLHRTGISAVETGTFGAMMNVDLTNKGPVTLLLEK